MWSTLVKTGTGTLTLSGSDDNSGFGAVVHEGTLVLAKSSGDDPDVHAIGGGGITMDGGTVRLAGTGDSQIYYWGVVSVSGSGVFDLNGQTNYLYDVELLGTGLGDGGAGEQQQQPGGTLFQLQWLQQQLRIQRGRHGRCHAQRSDLE